MKKLLQSIGYTDFTMLDVVTPTKPRLISVLSVLVHYMAFRHKAWNIVNKPLKQSVRRRFNHNKQKEDSMFDIRCKRCKMLL